MEAYIINEPNRSPITCTGFGGRTICLPHGVNGDTTVLFSPDYKKQQKGQKRMAEQIPDTIAPGGIAPVIMNVPNTGWTDLYEAEIGFGRGTVLKQLDKPFLGRFFDKSRSCRDYQRNCYMYADQADTEMDAAQEEEK